MSFCELKPGGDAALTLTVKRGADDSNKKWRPVRVLLVPLASSLVLVTASPAQAGFFSGSSGWGPIPLPSIPTPEQIKQIQEKQKKKYEDFDANFKKSSYVEELLKRSKEKAAKNKQALQDKYCERQAEWGVGDCSLAASTPEEKEKFMEILKQRREANLDQ